MKTKTKIFEFKTYEQAQEFLEALDEVSEKNDIDYIMSNEDDVYNVYVTFSKNTDELDIRIVNDIYLKIIIKL